MIGIDISDQTIKIVQLSRGKSKRMLSHCIYSLPDGLLKNGVMQDRLLMQEELRKAIESCQVLNRRDSVVASIAETQSFLRVVEMPMMDDDEINEAVRWEIAQHIPFSIDSVYVDWEALAGSGHTVKADHREIQVGAAQKKVVDALYSVMDELGLDVAAFELESQAIVRALISPDQYKQEGVLIVDFGSSSINVIVYDYGASRFTASLQRGVMNVTPTLTKKDATQLMQNLSSLTPDLTDRIAPQIVPEIDRLVADIKGVADFYNSIDSEHAVREIILAGGGSNLPGMDDAFLRHFDDIHIQRGNPWVNIRTGKDSVRPPMDIQESVRFTTALGLALREVVPL